MYGPRPSRVTRAPKKHVGQAFFSARRYGTMAGLGPRWGVAIWLALHGGDAGSRWAGD